jgi:hypothetical protein
MSAVPILKQKTEAITSPAKLARQQGNPNDSAGHRITRLSSSKMCKTVDASDAKTTTSCIPSLAALLDSMNRKLVFKSTELERRRESVRQAPDAPSFDL